MRNILRQKIGILGGGQLGKMLCQAGSRWGLDISILDADPDYPAGQVNPSFVKGNFKSYEDVKQFGKNMDIITVEIEHVSIDALDDLEKEGKKVYPSPSVLRTIADKGLQKTLYANHQIPTAPFHIVESKERLEELIDKGIITFPFVQKLCRGGYDGQGVKIIRTKSDLSSMLSGPSVIEEKVDIEKELAVIVARSSSGEIKTFPCVEMDFHEDANLVEWLQCPAEVSVDIANRAASLAVKVSTVFGTVGLLAVEMFLTKTGEIFVNEVAPRPHNSGHPTIECCITSQYEQLLRAITGLPLGDTTLIRPGVMVNVLGEEGYSGPVVYQGFDTVLKISGANVHLYGKSETRPFRKMGHITITANNLEEARIKAKQVKQHLKVTA